MRAHGGEQRQPSLSGPRHRPDEEALGIGVGAEGQHVEIGQRLVRQTQHAVPRHMQFEPRRCAHLGDERAHAELDYFLGLIHRPASGGECLDPSILFQADDPAKPARGAMHRRLWSAAPAKTR
jgi:hypothetical protein